ncbi:amidohydrolase family protein [Novosphingobium sp.]|uniref:amidohydrolase family protein n=1 Tax=Novosphingobium sp. TaxID=1874826 RepID=UPI00286E907E|nr:amidohydrolase family protein [Novosphingobium sp.]
MGWIKKSVIGTAATLGVGYLALAYVTRDVEQPVVHLAAAGKLMLTGVTIVDPRNGAETAHASVLMDKGRILAIGHGDLAPGDTSVQRVAADGKFLVPGYNDMHAHPLNAEDPSGDLALMLANGITGFRQMSASDRLLRERRESRLPIGLEAPALLIAPGALLTPLNASKPEQAQETMRDEKRAGADFIKAAFVSGPALFAAIDEGKRIGIPVVGHVPAGVDVVEAAERGMHAIEHLGPANGLLIACSSDGERILADVRVHTKFPTMPAFKSHIVEKLAGWALEKRIINPAAADREAGDVVPMRRALATFDEARCRTAIDRINAAGTWQVPTLIRLKTIYTADDPTFASNPNLRYVVPAKLAKWREVTAQFVKEYPAADRQTMRQGYAFSLRLVKLLDEQGAKMLAGSDASGSGWEVPGFALHQEFDELGLAGLAPLRILQMTTSDAADFLGRAASMGHIGVGTNADMVLLDRDPTKDVTALHAIAGVVRAGYYYDAAKLAQLKARVDAGQGYLK